MKDNKTTRYLIALITLVAAAHAGASLPAIIILIYVIINCL